MIPANEIKAWSNVVSKPPTKKQYLMNLEEKMQEKEFFDDTTSLLRTDESYDHEEAYDIVKKSILNDL